MKAETYLASVYATLWPPCLPVTLSSYRGRVGRILRLSIYTCPYCTIQVWANDKSTWAIAETMHYVYRSSRYHTQRIDIERNGCELEANRSMSGRTTQRTDIMSGER